MEPNRPRARNRRGSVSAEVMVPMDMPVGMMPGIGGGAPSGPEAAPIRGSASKTKTVTNRDKIQAVIADHILFDALDRKQKEMLVESFFFREYTKGDTVIRQGEEGNLFYVVEQGTLSVYIKPNDEITGYQKVKTYNEGDSFGELALMYNQPRAASVRVVSPNAVLWAVDRKTVQYLVQVTNSQKKAVIQEALHKIRLMKNLDHEQISRLADSIQPEWFKAGDEIVREGDDSQALCILIQGAAFTKQVGSDEVLRSYMPGDFFGELALLTGGVRAATVLASEDSLVFALDSSTFERMLGPCSSLLWERMESIRAESSMGFNNDAPANFNQFGDNTSANGANLGE